MQTAAASTITAQPTPKPRTTTGRPPAGNADSIARRPRAQHQRVENRAPFQMRLSSMIGPARPRPWSVWALVAGGARCCGNSGSGQNAACVRACPSIAEECPRIPTGGGRTFGLDLDVTRALPRLLFGWRARAVSGQYQPAAQHAL